MSTKMAQRRPRRLADFDYFGEHRYFFTMCTLRRRTSFADPRVVSVVREQFVRTAADMKFAVIAYTFMPDHLHAVVDGLSPPSDFRAFCSTMRRRSSSECWQYLRESVWQNGYHERVLREASSVKPVIRYILANPVRAGLVERASDYPYSWSVGDD